VSLEGAVDSYSKVYKHLINYTFLQCSRINDAFLQGS
jgi:hypothetical protein